MKLPFDLDGPLFVPVALGVLGFNVLCLALLLTLRPAKRRGKSAHKLNGPRLGPALLAEFLGTFALIFVGVLVVIGGPLVGQPAPGLLVVALAHGGVIGAMIAAVGAASGGHFNPAVTLGFVFASRLGIFWGIAYILAQLAGAAAAAYLLGWMFTPEALLTAIPHPASGINPQVVVGLEALACLVLIVVIFGTAVDPRARPGTAPVAIGQTVTMGILTIGPLTGGALNPARYLAPAVVAMNFDHWIFYIAGPCVGCALGAVMMQFFYVDAPEETEPVTRKRTPRQTRSAELVLPQPDVREQEAA